MRADCRACFRHMAAFVVLLTGVWHGAVAQGTPEAKTRVLTLEEAVTFALKNYPAVRASLEQVNAARAGVGLARTNYLPRADMLWQANRASRNNVFGLLLPQSVIPTMSGPVLSTTSGQGVWGSAEGLLFSWEPIDFGARQARVGSARAVEAQANAQLSVTRLDVAVATVNSFLSLVAAEKTVSAA